VLGKSVALSRPNAAMSRGGAAVLSYVRLPFCEQLADKAFFGRVWVPEVDHVLPTHPLAALEAAGEALCPKIGEQAVGLWGRGDDDRRHVVKGQDGVTAFVWGVRILFRRHAEALLGKD
jgi:hypothetical protein